MFLLIVIAVGCVSTKLTIKNIDDNAPIPTLNKEGAFVITQYATDPKYGFDRDYPINVFYRNSKDESINQVRFLNALAGPNGEKIFYKKIESCCPFPTKKSEMGAGFLDVYEVSWIGQKRPLLLYMNIYEKGALMVPVGFSLKKLE